MSTPRSDRAPREAGASAPAAPANSALRAALAYAARGWPVFPVAGIVRDRCTCGRAACEHPAKHPLTRHGLHDASVDVEQIATWWRRWTRANVAISTGPSALAVIDVDPANGGWDSLGRLYDEGYRWDETATVVTGGRGIHLYFAAPTDRRLGNSVSSLPGVPFPLPGVDLRARGGYVIAPPSTHASGRQYEWLGEDDVALAPAWLRKPLRESSRVPRPPISTSDCTRYGLAAVADEVARVRMAAVGTRNHELNRAAFALGQLVASGHLTEALVWDALIDAGLDAGLGEPEVRRTIRSGLLAGQHCPRVPEPDGGGVG